VRQPVFTGFALLSSFELAKLGIDQSEMDFELEKLDLALRVKEAYFNVAIADIGIEVAEKDVEARKSNLKVARSFYEVGMVPVNDVLRAEVELANSTQDLVSARNTARLARSGFNTVLSRPINAPVELEVLVDVEDTLAYKTEWLDFEAYVAQALEKRPEMKLININILQVDQETRLAKSKYYPEIAVSWDYIREGDDFNVSGDEFHEDPRWQATAALSWTFWEWGKTHYAVKEKESLKRQLMLTKLDLETNIQLEIKDAILRVKNAEENIPTTQKAVEQGEENLRVNDERYKAQVTTITEVLDAQSLLTRARVNYYRALYNHHLARASLERALGTY
jgi:outer membrane protein